MLVYVSICLIQIGDLNYGNNMGQLKTWTLILKLLYRGGLPSAGGCPSDLPQKIIILDSLLTGQNAALFSIRRAHTHKNNLLFYVLKPSAVTMLRF